MNGPSRLQGWAIHFYPKIEGLQDVNIRYMSE